MSHSSTERLIDYWRSRKGEALAPARADIDPTDFPTLLPQVFILGRVGPGDYVFRLAGGLLGELHGRDLRNVGFSSLWVHSDRIGVQTTLENARYTGEPAVLTVMAKAGPQAVTLEVLLAPLTNPKGEVDRFLGLYQPVTPLSHLRELPIDWLTLASLDKSSPANEDGPRLRLASVSGQLIG
ncbi:PAS domain-containing protein [soil metagenome]